MTTRKGLAGPAALFWRAAAGAGAEASSSAIGSQTILARPGGHNWRSATTPLGKSFSARGWLRRRSVRRQLALVDHPAYRKCHQSRAVAQAEFLSNAGAVYIHGFLAEAEFPG